MRRCVPNDLFTNIWARWLQMFLYCFSSFVRHLNIPLSHWISKRSFKLQHIRRVFFVSPHFHYFAFNLSSQSCLYVVICVRTLFVFQICSVQLEYSVPHFKYSKLEKPKIPIVRICIKIVLKSVFVVYMLSWIEQQSIDPKMNCELWILQDIEQCVNMQISHSMLLDRIVFRRFAFEMRPKK